jgi:heat shock protein 5
MIKNNNRLGMLELTGNSPLPCRVLQIEVIFDNDAYGILNVRSLEKSTGKENIMRVNTRNGRLSKDEIECIRIYAEIYPVENGKQIQIIAAKTF